MPEVSGPNAARIIGVDDSTIRRYVYGGLLQARRTGLKKIIRIDIDELRRFANQYQYRFDEKLATEVAEV